MSLLTRREFLACCQLGCDWNPEQGFVSSTSAADGLGLGTLTLIAQALSAQKSHEILKTLTPYFTLGNIKLHPLSSMNSSEALEINAALINQGDLASATKQLETLNQRFRVNIVWQPQRVKFSEPGLLIMDMDSTMISMECIDEIARAAGRYDQVSEVTARAMAGELDFNESLTYRVACLEGVKKDSLISLRNKMPLMPGLINLLDTLQNRGWKTAVVSGGFDFFTHYLKQELNLDAAFSNRLEFEGDKLTGKVIGDIVDGTAKRTHLDNLLNKWSIDSSQSLAIGDGANDAKMLDAAGLGVAFHAKPALKALCPIGIDDLPLDSALLLTRV